MLFSFSNISAQSVSITPYSGYTFKSSTDIDGGRASISGGHTFGGILTLALPINLDIEIQYSRHSNEVTARSIFLTDPVEADGVYNYLLAGINRTYTLPQTGLSFYGGTKFGVAFLTSPDDEFSTRTNFGVGLGVGSIFMMNEFAGIRLGVDARAPITGSGLNLWWGSGSGPQVGVSSWAPIVQFALSGGIVIKLAG